MKNKSRAGERGWRILGKGYIASTLNIMVEAGVPVKVLDLRLEGNGGVG